MKINRQIQFDILQKLCDHYPYQVDLMQDQWSVPFDEIFAQLIYLEEHGLCINEADFNIPEHARYNGSKITAKGIDFIADDGGVSAILNIVTVKFDINNVREILIDQLNKTSITEKEKETFIAHIKKIPAKILEAEILHLAQLGIGQIPNILPWIQKLTGL